jgi:hypothetical protein
MLREWAKQTPPPPPSPTLPPQPVAEQTAGGATQQASAQTADVEWQAVNFATNAVKVEQRAKAAAPRNEKGKRP